jgi:hydrogenase nickel incorporation protein HypB
MVHHELHHLDLTRVEYLFIENVGNLVCPAVYDLGQDVNAVALSVTEGEDKPLKYPTMFAKADIVLLTKTDLLPHLNVDLTVIYQALARVMPDPVVIPLASQQSGGVEGWIEWLKQRRGVLKAAS